jgi:hypothetical protein
VEISLDQNKITPEILAFNLNWLQENVKPSDIAKVLLSIPDIFPLNEIFKKS